KVMDRPVRPLRTDEAVEMAMLRRTFFCRVAVVIPLGAAGRVEHVARRIVLPRCDVGDAAKGFGQHIQPAFGEQGLAERELAQCEFFVLLSHCPVPVAEEAVEEARASSRRLAWEPAAGAGPAWVLPVRRVRPAWVLEA